MSEKIRRRIWISQKVYEMLEAYAEKTGKSPDQLATELLEIDLKSTYERDRKTGYLKG